MNSFTELGIQPEIVSALEAMGFETPTPIQTRIIPLLLAEPVDIVGLAQTGTGKTAAFGIPLVQRCLSGERQTQALVLCPTRELCMQVSRDLTTFAGNLPDIRIRAIYGGAGIETQLRSLQKGAHIIVATPGRLHDFMRRNAIDLSAIRLLVLDEADEMLQMGFQEELNAILAGTPDEKHTLLFSATMPRAVATIAATYMRKPLEITVGDRNAGSENVRHLYCMVHAKDRYQAMRRLIDSNPDMYAIIFCRTRQEVNEVTDCLIRDGYNADALHGDLSQSQRDLVMRRFRNRSLQLLVATDVAARGLDVQDLTHVINYNLPDDIANYTHRSGRTGRAGKTGVSIAIIHMRERFRIKEIEGKLKRRFELCPIPSGQEVCRAKIIKRIEMIKNVEVDMGRLEPFLGPVTEALADMDRESLLLRLIALEANHILAHYQNAPDLNVREKKGDREAFRRTETSPGAWRGKDERVHFSRFYLNVGQRDGLSPKRVIGQLNDACRPSLVKIGRIEILENSSMLEADSRFARQVIEAFHGIMVNGKPVQVKQQEGTASRRPHHPVGRERAAGPRGVKPPRPSNPNFLKKSRKKGGWEE